MYARVKPGCGILEAKEEIQQLKEKVEKLGEIVEKLGSAAQSMDEVSGRLETAVIKAERRGGEWSKRGYR